jgi:hypothetical protein
MPTASLLMMMFSPRLTNAKTKVEYEGTKNSPQTKKKTSTPEARHGSLPATQSKRKRERPK